MSVCGGDMSYMAIAYVEIHWAVVCPHTYDIAYGLSLASCVDRSCLALMATTP